MKFQVNKSESEEILLEASITSDINFSINFIDEPWAIRIIKSGWTKPQMYHVIFETGDYEQSDYLGLKTEIEIKEKWGIELPDPKSLNLNLAIKENPNDSDLGDKLRILIRNFSKKIKI